MRRCDMYGISSRTTPAADGRAFGEIWHDFLPGNRFAGSGYCVRCTVDQFVPILSQHRREGGNAYYHRPAEVLHPPVDWQTLRLRGTIRRLLFHGHAFAPYKRVDLAIQACNVMKRRTENHRQGAEEARLRKLAGPTVEFLGWQPGQRRAGSLCTSMSAALPGRRFWYRPVRSDGQACGGLRGGALKPWCRCRCRCGDRKVCHRCLLRSQSVESH